ncbi:hypothetical protein [Chitinophaga vietnamensis]|uniref:hypothetical protein n=1 Tax=Chitinophaga vietnamensis TaxID=2593957 RepID=UPI001177F40F|nr:hypothetical protein [Chitinophaga vietnamensis]
MKTKWSIVFSCFIAFMVGSTYLSLYELSSPFQHHMLKALLLVIASLFFITGAVISYTRMDNHAE